MAKWKTLCTLSSDWSRQLTIRLDKGEFIDLEAFFGYEIQHLEDVANFLLEWFLEKAMAHAEMLKYLNFHDR